LNLAVTVEGAGHGAATVLPSARAGDDVTIAVAASYPPNDAAWHWGVATHEHVGQLNIMRQGGQCLH